MEKVLKVLAGVVVCMGVGAILLATVGGYTSPSKVEELKSEAVDKALVAELVPGLTETCVAAAKADADLMAKFESTSGWQQSRVISGAKLVQHSNKAVKSAVETACTNALKE